MFIRRTQTRTAPTGETCFTHRLVRSERIASKVRQRTLLNLGRHFETKPEDWPALCRRIDELLCGQLAMHHDAPPALESQAQRITAQLLARERAGEREPVRAHDWQPVDVDSLELVRPRSVGVEHVGVWAMDQLGLRPIFHHKPIRAEGHLFITVLACQLVQVIRRRLRQGGEHASWNTLRGILEGHQRITATFRRADGRTLHVRKATRAEPPQRAIYDGLGLDPEPGGIRKTIV